MSFEEKGTWVVGIVSLVTFARVRGDRPGPGGTGAIGKGGLRRDDALGDRHRHRRVDRGVDPVAVVKPDEADKADVRDREINRFGEYVGGIVLGVAMIGPFALTLTGSEHFWIANAMYAAFVLAGLVSAVVKIVAYRRGL